jgi:outer membrane protein assembly factor BamA
VPLVSGPAGQLEAAPGTAPPQGDPGRPIETTATFRLEEAPRYQLSYGGRWESSEGIGVVVDAVDRNSFGRGRISGVRAIYSRDNQSLRFYHAVPRVLGPRNLLELFLEGSREILDQAVLERSADAWAQLTLPLTPKTQTRTYLRLREVKLSQIELDPTAPPLDERVASPQLGWQFVFDTSTRPLGQTRRGVFAGLDLSFAHEALGSDITSIGLFDQFKFFVPLARGDDPGFSWAQSWRTSFVSAQDEPVPFADRLFLGGEYSVRGYPTDSLGPLDADGVPIGGEFLFVVNQELHGRMFGPVTGLLFFDAGNVWENPQAIDADLFQSWGLGLRYVSPVGPLRLDVGFPLDRRDTDSEYTVYFGFGNVF